MSTETSLPAVPPPVLTCTSCGGDNAVGSRFCQHCGAALNAQSGSPAESAGLLGAAAEAAPARSLSTSEPQAAVPANGSGESDATAQAWAEADHRRSRKLLDKALVLSERGDVDGAILACKQAVTLEPTSSAAFSMLGLLWERAGEKSKAVEAYETALHLAPDSVLERESLQRLRGASTVERRLVAPSPATSKEPVSSPTPAVTEPSARPSKSVTAEPEPSVPTSIASPPVRVPTVGLPLTVAPIRPVAFDEETTASSTLALQWQAILRQPSFYFKAAPLTVTCLIGLAFLWWAQSWAASNRLPSSGSTLAVAQPNRTEDIVAPSPVTDENGQAPMGTAPLAPVPARTAPAMGNGTWIVSNAKPNRSGEATTDGGRNPDSSSNSRRPVRHGTAGRGGDAISESFVAPTIPLGPPIGETRQLNPVPPAAGSRASAASPTRAGAPSETRALSGGGDDLLLRSMPAPDLGGRSSGGTNASAPPISADRAPSSASGTDSSSGSSDSGSRIQGYIRMAPPQPARVAPERISPSEAPPRPENRGAEVEQSALQDAGAGRTSRAIVRMSQAIADGRDTGYRYQQRASMFLERRDYARAADDYQAAIAAYNDQIRRGERVNQARTGLEASHSGLRVSLSGLRR